MSRILFCNRGTESWRVTKKHLLKDEAILNLTAAASQTVSEWFHNALSGNYRFKTCNSEEVLILFPMQ